MFRVKRGAMNVKCLAEEHEQLTSRRNKCRFGQIFLEHSQSIRLLIAIQKLARTLPSTPKTASVWHNDDGASTELLWSRRCGKPKTRAVLRGGNLL